MAVHSMTENGIRLKITRNKECKDPFEVYHFHSTMLCDSKRNVRHNIRYATTEAIESYKSSSFFHLQTEWGINYLVIADLKLYFPHLSADDFEDKACEILETEYEIYKYWLEGNVFDYVVTDEHENVLDVGTGLYGYDYALRAGMGSMYFAAANRGNYGDAFWARVKYELLKAKNGEKSLFVLCEEDQFRLTY
jgi:hypothetical protein